MNGPSCNDCRLPVSDLPRTQWGLIDCPATAHNALHSCGHWVHDGHHHWGQGAIHLWQLWWQFNRGGDTTRWRLIGKNPWLLPGHVFAWYSYVQCTCQFCTIWIIFSIDSLNYNSWRHCKMENRGIGFDHISVFTRSNSIYWSSLKMTLHNWSFVNILQNQDQCTTTSLQWSLWASVSIQWPGMSSLTNTPRYASTNLYIQCCFARSIWKCVINNTYCVLTHSDNIGHSLLYLYIHL